MIDALRKFRMQWLKIATLQYEKEAHEVKLADLVADQERLRENLKAIEKVRHHSSLEEVPQSALTERYLETLNQAEDELSSCRKEMAASKMAILTARQEGSAHYKSLEKAIKAARKSIQSLSYE